jgi:hypothetical protein
VEYTDQEPPGGRGRRWPTVAVLVLVLGAAIAGVVWYRRAGYSW